MPAFFLPCADLFCPQFQGTVKSPPTYLPVTSDPPSLSDLGEPMKHTQASALCWRSFTSDCSEKTQKYPCVLQVTPHSCVWCAKLRGPPPGHPPSRGTLPQTQWKAESRAFFALLGRNCMRFEKVFENQNSHFFFLFFFLNLNSGTQIHKFHKCSCHALNCSFYLQTGFQSCLVVQWWGFYSPANLKGWGDIWKLFWHSAQEDYLNSIFRYIWYLHEAQSKNDKCVLYTYKYI